MPRPPLRPALLLPFLAAVAAAAPPPPPGSPPASPAVQAESSAEPASPLGPVIERLRDRPWAERVIASVADNRFDPVLGAPSGAGHTVRYDPASQRALLELGQIRVLAEPGRITAWSTRDDRLYLRQTFPGATLAETIRKSLPPLASPSLVLAAEGVARPFWVVGAPEAIPPDGLEVADPPEPELLALAGGSGDSTLSLVLDPRANRLLRTDSETFATGDLFQLQLDLRPLEPGDPDAWLPDLSTRDPVRRFSSLGLQAPPLRVGERMDDLRLLPPAAGAETPRPVNLFSAFIPDDFTPDPADRRLHAVVLLLTRAAPDADERLAPAKARLESIRQDLERQAIREGRTPPRFLIRPVLLAPAEPDARPNLTAFAEGWGSPPAQPTASQPGSRLPPILWSPTGDSLLDRLAPEAEAVAVVIASDRRIRAIARLDTPNDQAWPTLRRALTNTTTWIPRDEP